MPSAPAVTVMPPLRANQSPKCQSREMRFNVLLLLVSTVYQPEQDVGGSMTCAKLSLHLVWRLELAKEVFEMVGRLISDLRTVGPSTDGTWQISMRLRRRSSWCSAISQS